MQDSSLLMRKLVWLD